VVMDEVLCNHSGRDVFAVTLTAPHFICMPVDCGGGCPKHSI
jgi:hypothetical protein